MGLILNIESATKVCSVALAVDGEILAERNIKSEKYSHAEKLNGFIQEVCTEAKVKLSDLDAVAISSGPGSYTGLRIGTSTAKGICYALDIPLISVKSLHALALLSQAKTGLICPMFDARRMEVFTALYDIQFNEIHPTNALIVEQNSFENLDEKITFLGPGAEKCMSILTADNFVFDLNTEVSATGMISISESKFQKEEFEDVAYFEPAYLKDFIAGPPKKLL